MNLVTVGVADMVISSDPQDVLVTYALGSCLGVAIYDPVARIGGIHHVMLPDASISPEKAESNPLMFVDTGIPAFFRAAYTAGALKERLVIKVAGGASVQPGSGQWDVGSRNLVMLRKLFWKNRIMISGEDVGESFSRSLYLGVGSGRIWLRSQGMEWDL